MTFPKVDKKNCCKLSYNNKKERHDSYQLLIHENGIIDNSTLKMIYIQLHDNGTYAHGTIRYDTSIRMNRIEKVDQMENIEQLE